MNWFQKNFKTLIYCAFLVPILTVAVVSISHVTKWYGISNPVSWAIYLSVGIEIAALSALAAISANMGKKVYFPFAIVTLVQFIGNIFFAYQFIDINSTSFKDWVDMVDPVVTYLGVESGNIIGHKRFLALFAGGMLPLISLSFLHMLVKFEEDEKKQIKVEPVIDIDKLSIEAGKKEAEVEKQKYSPTQEELDKLEKFINEVYQGPEEVENDVKPYSPSQKDLERLEQLLNLVSSNPLQNTSETISSTNEKEIESKPINDKTSDSDFYLTQESEIEIYDSDGNVMNKKVETTEQETKKRLVYTK